jgi:hypothetical protein
LRRNITLEYGFRIDAERYPSAYFRDRLISRIQPRVGLSVGLGGGTTLHIAYGVYSDHVAPSVGQLLIVADALSRGNSPNASQLFANVAPLAGRFSELTLTGPGAKAAAITFLTTGNLPSTSAGRVGFSNSLDSMMRMPVAQRTAVDISKKLGRSWTLVALYGHLGASRIGATTGNLNAFQTGTTADGKVILGGRRFPELGDFFIDTDRGHATYDAVSCEISRRFMNSIGITSTYVWSQAYSDTDSLANLADYPEGLNTAAEWSLSRQNVRHRLTVAALADSPNTIRAVRGVQWSTLLTAESGRPFNVFAGTDYNKDGNPLSDRPGDLGRNSFKGPALLSVDLSARRTFVIRPAIRLQLGVDVFNLLNHTNVKDLNLVWGAATTAVRPNPQLGFNTPRETLNSRQVYGQLKLLF